MDPVDTPQSQSPSTVRAGLLRWVASLGAVTAESLAVRLQISVAAARARLRSAERDGLLVRRRPLVERPALYTVTRAGLRAVSARGLDPGRVSAAGALHLIECARVAAALERCYRDHRVAGERELRRDEREHHAVLASAELGIDGRGRVLRHRPDLVLWPVDPHAGLPVAVEVELTIKAPERLLEICRAWARARCVAGVIYIVAPDVERPLLRAIDRASAHERVVVVPLDALP
jgi:DNA-binding Lrp family transcriptional regulator